MIGFVLGILLATNTIDTEAATKLAQAVLGNYNGRVPLIYVAQFPPGDRPSFPLPHYTLLGSSKDSLKSSSFTLYFDAPAGALSEYVARLSASHFTRIKFVEAMTNRPRSGFDLEGESTSEDPKMDMLCGPDGAALMVSQSGGNGLHPLAIVVSSASAELRKACSTYTAFGAVLPTPPPAAPIPLLKAPPGFTAEPQTTQAIFTEESDNRARLIGAGSLSSVGAFFAAAYTRAGWIAEPPTYNEAIYAQVFRVSANGHYYRSLLTIVPGDKPKTFDAMIDAVDLHPIFGSWIKAGPSSAANSTANTRQSNRANQRCFSLLRVCAGASSRRGGLRRTKWMRASSTYRAGAPHLSIVSNFRTSGLRVVPTGTNSSSFN